MDDTSKRIAEKLDKIADDIVEIKVTLAEQHLEIAHHIHRTNLLEESVSALRNDQKPIERHVNLINALAKIFLAVIAAAGSIAAISKFLS